MSRHHSRKSVHKRMKRGRMGQIAAAGALGYYGFTTNGDVNVKSVEMSIFPDFYKNKHRHPYCTGCILMV